MPRPSRGPSGGRRHGLQMDHDSAPRAARCGRGGRGRAWWAGAGRLRFGGVVGIRKPKDNRGVFVDLGRDVELGWSFFGAWKREVEEILWLCWWPVVLIFSGPETEGSERFSRKLILLPVLSLGNSSVFRAFVVPTPFLLHAVGMFYLSLFNIWKFVPISTLCRKPLGRVRSTLLDRSLFGGPSWEKKRNCSELSEKKTPTALTLLVMKGLDTVRNHTTLFHRNPW